MRYARSSVILLNATFTYFVIIRYSQRIGNMKGGYPDEIFMNFFLIFGTWSRRASVRRQQKRPPERKTALQPFSIPEV